MKRPILPPVTAYKGAKEARPRKVLERDGIAPNKVADIQWAQRVMVLRINVIHAGELSPANYKHQIS